jgi:hypothetical protein
LLFVGASLALAAERVGWSWLFYVGLAMLVIALAMPSTPGQTLKQRASNLVAHIPGARLFRRSDGGG